AHEFLRDDALLLQEMTRLSAENRELLATLGETLGSETPPQEEGDPARLRAENAELRRAGAGMEKGLRAAPDNGAKARAEKEKEYDNLLEEKSEVIRSLHLKIQELQEQAAQSSRRSAPLPNEEELQAVCDELERERAQLEVERREVQQERAQLQEDEQTLM